MKQQEMDGQSVRPRRRPTNQLRVREPWPEELAHWGGEQPSQPPVRPVSGGRGSAWAVTLALLAVAIIVAGIATMFILEMWLVDRVLPGVYVWDVDVGGMTRQEAMEHLSASFRYPADRHPVLRYGERTWPIDPASLGTQLDVPATVEVALAIGHTGDWADRLREQASVLVDSRLVAPIYTFEPGIGTTLVSQIAQEVNKPLRDATLALSDDLNVSIIPGQSGRKVDEEATRQALVQRIAEMGGGEVELIIRESEPVLTDLSAVQSQVQRILSGPITLTAPDQEVWTIDPATLAAWLILRPTIDNDGNTTLSVSLDPGLATNLAQEIAAAVERQPTDAQFRFDDASGTLVAVVGSIPGQTLDISATVALIEDAASRDQRDVALPLLPVRPSLATEDGPSLGAVELIGEGVTSFAGSSAPRVQNIVVGAAQFDGLLIPPGETFSFNHYLGEVTAEKGYEESIIIWGNTTRADVGGGLCQVSSTAFRAAFWAGLPVSERWAHAFRVSYYEPPKGLDATIYSPSVDLKWVNDTGHYVLIQTYVDRNNSTLTFRYYGTNPGRTVEIDGPYEDNHVPHDPPVYREDPTLPKGETKQIEWAKDGLDVTVYRIIKTDGVEVQRDTFFSRYQPWQAVFLVGTRVDE
ncbi:MAG TPA: VanW family protein [Anaerolineae bacterium]|nr:VanW family protein [Anaerolineae bacterium]